MLEWLEPFLHSSNVIACLCQNGKPFWHCRYCNCRSRTARALWHLTDRARKARAIVPKPVTILECQNVSSHSCAQVMPCTGVLEWLEPFRNSRNATGRARMAQAIMALKHYWQSQNGLSHSCTQVMQLSEPKWLKPLLHSKILSWKCSNHSGTASYYNYGQWHNHECQNGSSHSSMASGIT